MLRKVVEDFSGVSLKKYIFGSGEPKILITAGIHGDEVTGVYAALQLIEELKKEKIVGSVVIIPVVNPLGFEARKRENPVDNVDLNRVFPDGSGSPITRGIVASIWDDALSSDYVLDLHCAGNYSYQYILALHKEFEAVRSFVSKIPWEIVVESTGLRGQLFIEATYAGIPSAIIETVGGQGYFSPDWGNKLVNILLNLLRNLEVIEGRGSVVSQRYLSRIERIKSEHSGFFYPENVLGKFVKENEILGRVDKNIVSSNVGGFVTGLTAWRYVFKGEHLASIAKYEEKDTK